MVTLGDKIRQQTPTIMNLIYNKATYRFEYWMIHDFTVVPDTSVYTLDKVKQIVISILS